MYFNYSFSLTVVPHAKKNTGKMSFSCPLSQLTFSDFKKYNSFYILICKENYLYFMGDWGSLSRHGKDIKGRGVKAVF